MDWVRNVLVQLDIRSGGEYIHIEIWRALTGVPCRFGTWFPKFGTLKSLVR